MVDQTSKIQPQLSFSSSYASSPLSTPSRTLNYTVPSTSASPSPYDARFDLSLTSSLGSSGGRGGSPAPGSVAGSPLAAYRGKHADRINAGREYVLLSGAIYMLIFTAGPLDGSFLAALTSSDADD